MKQISCGNVNYVDNIWENQYKYLKKSSSLQSARTRTLPGTLDFEYVRANFLLLMRMLYMIQIMLIWLLSVNFVLKLILAWFIVSTSVTFLKKE